MNVAAAADAVSTATPTTTTATTAACVCVHADRCTRDWTGVTWSYHVLSQQTVVRVRLHTVKQLKKEPVCTWC